MAGRRGGGLHLDASQNQQKLSEGNGKAIILQISVSPILYLQLRGAKLEDTGIFYCRGVNGFGSVRVRVELIVTGESRFLGLFFMTTLFQTRPVRT